MSPWLEDCGRCGVGMVVLGNSFGTGLGVYFTEEESGVILEQEQMFCTGS